MPLTNISIQFKKPSPYAWWRILSIVIFGFLTASLLLSGFFLYQHIFHTLDDATTVVLLNSDPHFDTINFDTYDKATEAIRLKQTSVVIPASLRSIFVYGAPSSTPATPATTTKK